MNYATIYFGKALEELTYEDVENFFVEEKEESTRLEFKAGAADQGNSFKEGLKGVTRGICALLNSEGGIMIWGAPKGQSVQGRKEEVFIGTLSPVSEQKGKDSLINTISDTIHPLPAGIAVKILNQGSGTVYVFEVQTSNYRPHQYKDTYWARLDGQTRPAPHYLIEALMKRITYPNVEGYLNIIKWFSESDYHIIDIEVIICNFSAFQNEENVLVNVTVNPGVFRYGQFNSDLTKSYLLEDHQVRIRNTETLHYGSPIIYRERIAIHYEELDRSKSEIAVTIIFGGRYSPLKSSRYTIMIRTISTQNYNDLIVDKKENVTIADRQRESGKGEKDFLKTYLKR